MNNKWDKILLELSYRVSSGVPDLSNEQHLMKLWDILKEHNWRNTWHHLYKLKHSTLRTIKCGFKKRCF